ncbi:transglycosylase SLT domain-containing protein [Kitasatospora sp. NPDC059648]|uniref:aggregation-promoting factor C-terminal-like domain-containing protein n=1 Tax=Kitasatospora sp. NPDC059648 TaxID=3346894 RepID=UPI0036BFBB93
MPSFKLRTRTSAAVLAGAAALTGLGAALVPATASAATLSPKAIAAQMVPANQLASFSQIIFHESSWNVHATNASSGAYGLGQALPASKMASAGADWRTNPRTQIKWALNYMNTRYGSPNAAWAFWQTHHWY